MLAAALTPAPAVALERVTLQLKHAHQFQFAGYYAALEQGYYREAGLDVRIVEAADSSQAERDVVSGKAEYGVGSSSLLLARLSGQPVVALGVIFQHSAYALAMAQQPGQPPDLRRLRGGRAMLGSMATGMGNADELLAYLVKEGVPANSYERLAPSYDPYDLVTGKVAAMAVYTTNEPDVFDRAGFAYDLYTPRAVGIDFYGDTLFTSERELASNPLRVRAFRAASLRGWQWAMSHHEETADLILNKYSRRNDREHLLYEARQMVPLVQPVLVEIGYMNPDRWRHIADVYASLGMLPAKVNFDGFLYDPDSRKTLVWLYRVLGAAVLLLLGAGAVHFILLARERRRSNAAIRHGEQRFRTMFEASPLGMALVDSTTYEYRDVNARYLEIVGRPLAELRTHKWLDISHADDVAQYKAQMSLLTAGRIAAFKCTSRVFRADGEVAWIDMSVTAIDTDTATEAGGHPHHLCMIEDVTAAKQREALIWQQANFDPLTQLPNRRMLLDRLKTDLVKSQRERSRLAILFIDLDHFKEVNDTLGHHQGDILLVDAARRISACVRKSDTVARLGGDEFTVILSELDKTERVEQIAQQIIDSLRAPFTLGQEQAFVSASIGITLYPDDALDIDDLLKHADQAMYAAKDAGRNRYAYFTATLQIAALNRMRLTNDLRSALKTNQLALYFQPIVHLASGRVHKAEALIRWLHPQRGMVSPYEFIPLAESSGLILDIGAWVFHAAADWARRWRTEVDADFQISINQSPLEFQHSDDSGGGYGAWLRHLRELDLPGQALVVEITEGLLLDVNKTVSDKLLQLRDAGIQVALDDFGTGYSSLSYLKKFDIDYLKIDRSFTRNLAPNSSDMALSDAIIVMAHKLGLKVIAEGVETPEQRDLLTAAGCDYGQGYLFAKPMPAADFDAFLRASMP